MEGHRVSAGPTNGVPSGVPPASVRLPNPFSGGQADGGRAVGPIPVCGSPVSTQFSDPLLRARFTARTYASYATAPGLRASFRERSTSSSGILGRRFDRVGWSCNCQLFEPAQARVLPPRAGRGGRGRRTGRRCPVRTGRGASRSTPGRSAHRPRPGQNLDDRSEMSERCGNRDADKGCAETGKEVEGYVRSSEEA